MSLKGKGAVITGSTSGIGLGIAQRLAAQGANIMLNGLGDPAEIERTRASIERDFKVDVRFNAADMSDGAACAALVMEAEEAFGSVDILVNNVGIQHVAVTEDFPVEKWQQVIDINLSSYFHTIHAALPGMKRRGWGRIINTASAHGLVASVNKAAYVAAKHGVIGLTKVVALENAESHVTCNAICPGWVRTPLVEAQIRARAENEGKSIEEAARDLLGEKQPSKRFATPEEIGELAVFLCSEAAQNITGAALPVDGGWTAQ